MPKRYCKNTRAWRMPRCYSTPTIPIRAPGDQLALSDGLDGRSRARNSVPCCGRLLAERDQNAYREHARPANATGAMHQNGLTVV